MIGTPKGGGRTGTRYAGLGVPGSGKGAVGSAGMADRKLSGVDEAGTGTTDAATPCGAEGWLRASGASNRERTIKPGRSRRVITAGARQGLLLPDSMFDASFPSATGGNGSRPRAPRTRGADRARTRSAPDRKSTRLNSSHQIISYAVFCLNNK